VGYIGFWFWGTSIDTVKESTEVLLISNKPLVEEPLKKTMY
jgi:hypothetical protein